MLKESGLGTDSSLFQLASGFREEGLGFRGKGLGPSWGISTKVHETQSRAEALEPLSPKSRLK